MLKASFQKYRLHFKEPSGTSRGILLDKDTYFIRIWEEGAETCFGLGECALFRGLSAEDRPDYEEKLREVCNRIAEIETASLQEWSSIRFGVEMAFADLRQGGKRIYFPSAFSAGEAGIEINGLIWMGDRETMLQRIRAKLDAGFHCIKVKIGAIDFQSELDLLKFIRRRFGREDVELRVDANGAFSPETALERLDALAKYDLHSIEQPIRQGQWREMARLCARTPVPIALDEELIGVNDAGQKRELLEAIRPRYIILKPALARGDLRAIGATTLNEYQKYFEKDKALERRFQKVMIDEPDVMSAISIMRGLKEKYENHHKVRITDDAIIASVELSHRYISDRFLPDKAIDLVDEAAAKLRLEMNSVPEEIDELDRKIQQLEIEKEALKREGTSKKLSDIQKELADLNDERTKLRAQWESERSLIDEIQKNKDAIEQYKFEASRAEREGDYGKVAELRYGKIKEAEQRIEVVKKKLADMKHGESLIREEVTSDDIAAVVSKWTGIPVNRMMQSERTKLLHLEEELHKRVVGQEVAIAALADAVRRNRAGLQDARRPIGSFIFLGTTGVGKTELAKALAEFLFDDETQMTRIDMSEYQEKHSVSRLIGAPPGYIGYDEGGQLTEAVRRKPYSVVLLDEIEKAHPDVFNILLQVLDDGRLTDNKGRTVDFKNTIVIMTSNIGAHIIQERLKDLNEKNRDQVLETTNNEVYELLKQTIRPEFLNRIDEVIMFTPLQKNEIVDIVRLQVKSLQKMLANNSITIEVTDKAVEWIAQEGYDPQFGARPVKRVIQRNLLNDLSKQILAEKITKDNQIVIDVKDDHIVFTNK